MVGNRLKLQKLNGKREKNYLNPAKLERILM